MTTSTFSAATSNVSTIARPEFKFLISVQSPSDGTWKEIGFVTKESGKRLSVDKTLDGWIRPATKNRDNLLKSCKFLMEDSATCSVDWVPTRPWTTFRTHKVIIH
jgi:hypothetical protein